MTMTVSRGCRICGWESKPTPYQDGQTVTLDTSEHNCEVEPLARALCDAKEGPGFWDTKSTPRVWEKYSDRAREIIDALAAGGLTITSVPSTCDPYAPEEGQ